MKYKKIIAGLLAICFASSAYSFKVAFYGVGKPIHEQITADALKGINVVLANGQIAYFSEDAIKGIQEENTENDEKGIEYGYMHFDDSRITESSRYAWNATNTAINEFINSSNGLGNETNYNWGVADGLSVITNLGTATHTIQDFFAHSTWVETNVELKAFEDNNVTTGGFVQTNRKKYIPVPLLGIEENPFETSKLARYGVDVRVFDDEEGKTGSSTSEVGGCRPKSGGDSPKYDARVLQISSAYYDYRMSFIPPANLSEDFIGGSTSDWNTRRSGQLSITPTLIPMRTPTGSPINWPIDFCTHGEDGPGINKDHEKRDGHLKAYNAAMQATRAMALHFLDKSGATSLTSLSRACFSTTNPDALLKCIGTGTGSIDPYKISSIKALFPNIATEDFKPSFQFEINETLANQGLLSVTYAGEACRIYDDDKNSTTKTFLCDSDKKGAGKLRITQRALSAIPLYESDTFAIVCENGLSSANGGVCKVSGNIISDTVAPFFVEVGKTISLWLKSTGEGIKTVVWNFGEGIAEKTVAFSSSLGVSDSVTQSFSTLGPKTITATLKGNSDTVLGQSTTNVTVTAAPLPTVNITSATSDTPTQPGAILKNGSTDDTTPTLSGTISAPLITGQKVNVYDGATMYYAPAVVNGTTWTFTPATQLTPGSHSFTVEVASFDGTPGVRSAAFVIIVSNAASVTSITPASATIGVATTFTVTGQNLPQTAVLSIADGSCDAGTYRRTGSGTEFTITCTPGGPAGKKLLTVKTNTLANNGTEIAPKATYNVMVLAAGTLSIPATAYVRGTNVALSVSGYGVDTLMNAPPYGAVANAAEWDITVPVTGRYELFATYAAGTSRPVTISFNGTTVFTNALAVNTGGFFPANRQTFSQGFVQLAAGVNVMRVARAEAFPHIQGFSLVPVASTPITIGKLPDTGITSAQCYQAGSITLVSCSSEVAIALNYKQDGMLGRDVSNPDNADGKLGFSYSTVGNYAKTECVKDNITGLTWEGKPTSGVRAAANQYTNYGDKRSGDATAYVDTVNATVLCGYSDWRLPTADELESLVDYGVALPGPTIDTSWFPNTQNYYWTSSSFAGNAGKGWYVNFNNGGVSNYVRSGVINVRLVR